MSIVWSLKRLFDPATHLEEEGERHAEREQPEDTDAGDPPRFEVAAQRPVATPVQRFHCRVCSYRSQASAYCPECLADTMVPAPPEPPAPPAPGDAAG
jgi:hypothetical protein